MDCGFAWNSRSAINELTSAHSITILNRLVTWTDRGIELEADPRHVDLLLNEVGCVGCEGAKVTTPLVKERVEEALNAEDLDEELYGLYCSASMRLAYLSQDRPDLLVLGKELAKGLKRPTVAHFQNAEARRFAI